MTDQIRITSREQWLQARKQDITASTCAALLSIHPYCSHYQLWAEKRGLISNDTETPAMRRGTKLEPLAIDELKELHPDWKIERPTTYYRDRDVRLGATPDCFATDPERLGFGVIQIKSVEPRKFIEQWMPDDMLMPPPWIAVQTIIEAHLTGASWAMVAALVVSHGIDLHLVEVPIHPAIIERIKAETIKFWTMVEEGRQPQPDYGMDADLIDQLYTKPQEIEVDLTGDNELPEIVQEFCNLGQSLAEIEKLRKARRAEILHKLGNATAARIATGRISARVVKRKAYAVPESSYRNVKFKEEA